LSPLKGEEMVSANQLGDPVIQENVEHLSQSILQLQLHLLSVKITGSVSVLLKEDTNLLIQIANVPTVDLLESTPTTALTTLMESILLLMLKT